MKRTILLILSLALVYLSACSSSDAEKNEDMHIVNDAIDGLLSTENYSSEWTTLTEETDDENNKENEEIINSIIFHSPYKLKSEFTKFEGSAGLVGISKYQVEQNGEIADTFIYSYEDGSYKRIKSDEVVSFEWFLIELRNGLVTSEYISEETSNDAVINKFKISVNPYPFVGYFGLSLDKSDELTKIFIEEYQNCTGYAYIDTSTKCINKLEFDLSDKTKLNSAIIEKVQKDTGVQWFALPEYKKFFISIIFYDINDESAECAEIEKEIDEIMATNLD